MMSSVAGMVGAQELRPQVDAPAGNDATVAFSDQTTNGTAVTVDSVNTSDGGFVVIHDDSLLDGEVTGSVIGVSEYLEPGEHENVTVTLFDDVPGATFDRTELTGNETLIAMPHRDTNANGTYDFVATDGSEDGPYVANGSAVTDAANVTVEASETTGESFVVDDLTAPEVVERGDALDVTATVENPNDEADTQTVEYRFDGNVSAREEVSLDAGESTDFTTTVNTSEIDSDAYIHGVYTREDGQPARVLIVDEIVSFGVTDLTAPESVTAGENVTVNATVSNPNEFAHEQPVQFRFDGDLVETRTVDLDGENSTTVQFEIPTDGTPAGTYIHSVFSNDFGQDAIITIEAPDDESGDTDDGDADDGDADDGEDADEGEDADDGEGADDGEDADDGEGDDSDAGDDSGEDESDDDADGGEDADDGDSGEDESDDDADGDDDADDDDSGEDESDDGEDGGADDGEGADDGDAEDGGSGEDGEADNDDADDDSGDDESDEAQPETPEDG
ncbi:CARDB domain-containing protein [Halorubrum rubrum]|uniref:CARDB domain-containing protein n=2 Tax=Halorubrum rubrum TaxID=1126240 RepID=A0ABD5R3G1_9EURY